MSRMKRNWDLRVGLLVGLVVAAGCDDMLLNEPAPGLAGLAVSYTLAEAVQPTDAPQAAFVIDRARVSVYDQEDNVLDEKGVDLGAPGEETRVQLAVPMDEDFRTVRVRVRLFSEDALVGYGSAVAEMERGTTTQVGVQVRINGSWDANVTGAVTAALTGLNAEFCDRGNFPHMFLASSDGHSSIQLYGRSSGRFAVTTYAMDSQGDARGYFSTSAGDSYATERGSTGTLSVEEYTGTTMRGSFDFYAGNSLDPRQVHLTGSFTAVIASTCR